MRAAIEAQLDQVYHKLLNAQLEKDVNQIDKYEKKAKYLEDLLDGTIIREEATREVDEDKTRLWTVKGSV